MTEARDLFASMGYKQAEADAERLLANAAGAICIGARVRHRSYRQDRAFVTRWKRA